jgi:hypothetical protein
VTEVTRRQLVALIQAADGVAVESLRPDAAQAGIQWGVRGRANHFLCLLGALDVVEADITGIAGTLLSNYLRGDCVLKFYRVRPYLTEEDRAKVRTYWLDQVGKSYGWGSVFRAAQTTFVRRYVVPVAPQVGRLLLRDLSNVLGHQEPDCSALWVNGIRQVRPKFFKGWDSSDVTPETVVRHDAKEIECIRTLDRPILRKEDR